MMFFRAALRMHSGKGRAHACILAGPSRYHCWHACILHLPKNPNQFFVWQKKCISIGHKEKGRGLYREAFQPPVLCRRREPQRRATGACECLSSPKHKKSPYGSPAPQESNRTIQHVYSSCYQLGLGDIWQKIKYKFPNYLMMFNISKYFWIFTEIIIYFIILTAIA